MEREHFNSEDTQDAQVDSSFQELTDLADKMGELDDSTEEANNAQENSKDKDEEKPAIKPLRTDYYSGGTSSSLVTAKDLEDAEKHFENVNRRNAAINKIAINPLNKIIGKIRKK